MIYIIFCRIFELVLSNRNTAKLIKEGAIECYNFHYNLIVLFHAIFIIFFFVKSFLNSNLNIEYLFIFMIVQVFRYKVIYDLGTFWITRIIVIEKPLIKTWIFRNLRHPNYIVVFLEVILVCLFFDDIMSLIFFTLINFILITTRIYYEEKANKFRQKL